MIEWFKDFTWWQWILFIFFFGGIILGVISQGIAFALVVIGGVGVFIWNGTKHASQKAARAGSVENDTAGRREEAFMKILFLPFLFAATMMCSCASVETSVKLRPDLTNDDTEIWQISGIGNSAATFTDVDEAIKKEAAKKSRTDGYDCFSMLDSKSDIYSSSVSFTTTQTMHGSTNYYSNTGASYGRSNYSYQTPVTQTIPYSIPSASWYVVFYKNDDCKNLENTKWRENIFYNKNILTEEIFYEKSSEAEHSKSVEPKFILISLGIGTAAFIVVTLALGMVE